MAFATDLSLTRSSPSSSAETEDSSSSSPTKPCEDDMEMLSRRVFSCRRCSYKTDRKNNLKRHMTAMHEFTAQKLECCGIRFLNKSDLKNHNSKFHLDGYKCPVCQQHFVRKALLERHFSVHTGEKKFACECGYRTSHKSNLERHYKTHLKEPSLFKEPIISDRTSQSLKERSFVTSFRGCMTFPKTKRLLSTAVQVRQQQGRFPSPLTLAPSNSLPILDKAVSTCTVVSPRKAKRGYTVEELLKEDDQVSSKDPTADESSFLMTRSQSPSPFLIRRPQPRHMVSQLDLQWNHAINTHNSTTCAIIKPQPIKMHRSVSAFEPLPSRTNLPASFHPISRNIEGYASMFSEVSKSSSYVTMQKSLTERISSSSSLSLCMTNSSPVSYTPPSSSALISSWSPLSFVKRSLPVTEDVDMTATTGDIPEKILKNSYIPKKWRLRKSLP